MSEVEQLAQEQFNTFKNRLCEILSEIEEEYKSAFIQGYAKGETDEKFRTKQVVTSDNAVLQKENVKVYAEQPYKGSPLEQKKQLEQAKELIKNIIRVTWGEGWNYSLDWKVKAEQFIKEIKENE